MDMDTIIGFSFVASVVIGITWIIVKIFRDNGIDTTEERRIENRIDKAYTSVKNIKTNSDSIVSLIKIANETVASTKAKKILKEAGIQAEKPNLALERVFKIAEKTKGKLSERALDDAQYAERVANGAVKDIDVAKKLYDQAMSEELDWDRLQKEVNDAVYKAKNAADNAAREAAKVRKMAFTSVEAKDAAEKAVYASVKAKEAAEKAVKRRESATRAISAQDAQIEVTQAKYAEKRALVEEKITVDEAKIAMECG
jgi:hypothetical protein